VKLNLYIFRDYWSNRNGYSRNKFEETWLLDCPGSVSKSFPSELAISTTNSRDRCDVLFENMLLASRVTNPEGILGNLRIEERALFRESELYFVRRKVFLVLRIILLLVTIPPILWTVTTNQSPLLLIPIAPLLLSSIFWNKLQSIFTSHLSVLIFTAGLSLTLISVFFDIDANKIIVAALATALILLAADLYFYLVNWILRLQSSFSKVTLKEHVHITLTLIAAVSIVNISIWLFLPDRIYDVKWIGLSLGVLMLICATSFSTHLGTFAKITAYFYHKSMSSPIFPYKIIDGKPVDDIYWLDDEFYWVFRFMYYWLWELSLSKGFPFITHPDYERFEVWVNAISGQIEWLVSDYHYRELWYRPANNQHTIFIDWDDNFHTIVPLIDQEQIKCYKELSKASLTGWNTHFQLQSKLTSLEMQAYQQHRRMHPSKDLEPFFRQNEERAASVLASLPWEHYRYAYGARNDQQARRKYTVV